VPQKVERGLSDGTLTEITSGLSEGDWIARRIFTVQEVQKGGFSFSANAPAAKKPAPKK
jgi:hypothetical protein